MSRRGLHLAAGVLCLYLVVFPGTALAATEQVQDGSFEAGFSGWVFDDGAERCEVNGLCGPFSAASGSFYAASKTLTSLGPGASKTAVGTITQLVPVPALPAALSFALREVTEVGPIGTLQLLLQVKYDGQVLEEISAAGSSFETVTIPIPGVLGGPSARPLTFEITCSNNTISSESCARFDIDDVSLLTTTSPLVSTEPQPLTPPDISPPETALAQMKRLARVRSAGARAKVKARFSSEAGARFECRLDRQPYAPCASPKILKLRLGKHVFRVRSVDAAGNVDPTPAKATIRVKLTET